MLTQSHMKVLMMCYCNANPKKGDWKIPTITKGYLLILVLMKIISKIATNRLNIIIDKDKVLAKE